MWTKSSDVWDPLKTLPFAPPPLFPFSCTITTATTSLYPDDGGVISPPFQSLSSKIKVKVPADMESTSTSMRKQRPPPNPRELIGGNLVMSQKNNFSSDIAKVLLAVDSKVSIVAGLKEEEITLEEFLARPRLGFNNVLVRVHIPCWKPFRNVCYDKSDTKLLFETYCAAPRPLGNALPYLNAAFLADTSPYETGVTVNKIRLSFDAYGTKHVIRARNVEDYLAGKILSVDILYEAVRLVRTIVSPDHGTSDPAYQSS